LGLAVSSRFDEWRAERVGLLESRLQEIDAIAFAGKLAEAVITAEGLSISPIRKDETDESESIARRLYGMLPRLRITELLAEVHGWTRFSEAAHILDGLLHLECSLEIREHYTDTAGAIEHVFGLCHLLGFRFAPRIRDLADRRLYVADSRAVYTALNPMIGGTLDFRGISENWNEALRGAASIKAGTVAPSALMRRLAAYPKQNALAKTLREIGRLERTLFTLDWIIDPALRRRSNAGLSDEGKTS
jgi:hypothetical protein